MGIKAMENTKLNLIISWRGWNLLAFCYQITNLLIEFEKSANILILSMKMMRWEFRFVGTLYKSLLFGRFQEANLE